MNVIGGAVVIMNNCAQHCSDAEMTPLAWMYTVIACLLIAGAIYWFGTR